LVKKVVFDPDPDSDLEIPVKKGPEPEFPSKSDLEPKIIFSDPTSPGEVFQTSIIYR